MSKTKHAEIGHYEVLFIEPNKFTETEAENISKKVEEMIASKKGEITYRENWGKRKFAYPIKGYNHGYYTLFEFNLPAEKLADLDRYMRLSDEILRHQIVKKKIKTAEQLETEKKINDKIAAKSQEEKAEEEKKSEQKEEKSGKEKVDLKDLDEKLDNILNSGDLI